METKDTLSSYSESEEQQMQLSQDKSKESCMVSFQRLLSQPQGLDPWLLLKFSETQVQIIRETLVLFMDCQKSIDERALHKREHDSRVNERQMQTTMEKLIRVKQLDASSNYH
ncbi:hypothetical protein Tco_0065964 [Tanacetum coccineum]